MVCIYWLRNFVGNQGDHHPELLLLVHDSKRWVSKFSACYLQSILELGIVSICTLVLADSRLWSTCVR